MLFAVALVAAVPLGATVVVDLGAERRPAHPMVAGAIVVVASIAAACVLLGRGPWQAILAGPWWVVTVALAIATVPPVVAVVKAGRLQIEPWRVGILLATGFLVVGASWAIVDRAGLEPFGFGRTIVILTAVHFHVAGFVLTLAGSLVARERPGRDIHAALVAVVIGMPLTALGFFGFPIVSWVGALLVASGGVGIGAATVAIASRTTDRPARACLVVGGATLLLTMPLAGAYATGTTFGIAFLDIPAMAALHGGLNVAGFAIPTMIGWRRIIR